jgi:DnaJ-class molecular chaperone
MEEKCPACKGKTGKYIPAKDLTGEFTWDWETCWECMGTGKKKGAGKDG